MSQVRIPPFLNGPDKFDERVILSEIELARLLSKNGELPFRQVGPEQIQNLNEYEYIKRANQFSKQPLYFIEREIEQFEPLNQKIHNLLMLEQYTGTPFERPENGPFIDERSHAVLDNLQEHLTDVQLLISDLPKAIASDHKDAAILNEQILLHLQKSLVQVNKFDAIVHSTFPLHAELVNPLPDELALPQSSPNTLMLKGMDIFQMLNFIIEKTLDTTIDAEMKRIGADRNGQEVMHKQIEAEFAKAQAKITAAEKKEQHHGFFGFLAKLWDAVKNAVTRVIKTVIDFVKNLAEGKGLKSALSASAHDLGLDKLVALIKGALHLLESLGKMMGSEFKLMFDAVFHPSKVKKDFSEVKQHLNEGMQAIADTVIYIMQHSDLFKALSELSPKIVKFAVDAVLAVKSTLEAIEDPAQIPSALCYDLSATLELWGDFVLPGVKSLMNKVGIHTFDHIIDKTVQVYSVAQQVFETAGMLSDLLSPALDAALLHSVEGATKAVLKEGGSALLEAAMKSGSREAVERASEEIAEKVAEKVMSDTRSFLLKRMREYSEEEVMSRAKTYVRDFAEDATKTARKKATREARKLGTEPTERDVLEKLPSSREITKQLPKYLVRREHKFIQEVIRDLDLRFRALLRTVPAMLLKLQQAQHTELQGEVTEAENNCRDKNKYFQKYYDDFGNDSKQTYGRVTDLLKQQGALVGQTNDALFQLYQIEMASLEQMNPSST